MRDDDLGIVDDLLAIESGLTDWEVEFAESLAAWLEERDELTPKQRAKALAILEEKG